MTQVQSNFKGWLRAALIRAVKTVAQTLLSTIPGEVVITPAIIEHFNVGYVVIVASWLATGLVAGVLSIITSLAGLPEVEEV